MASKWTKSQRRAYDAARAMIESDDPSRFAVLYGKAMTGKTAIVWHVINWMHLGSDSKYRDASVRILNVQGLSQLRDAEPKPFLIVIHHMDFAGLKDVLTKECSAFPTTRFILCLTTENNIVEDPRVQHLCQDKKVDFVCLEESLGEQSESDDDGDDESEQSEDSEDSEESESDEKSESEDQESDTSEQSDSDDPSYQDEQSEGSGQRGSKRRRPG